MDDLSGLFLVMGYFLALAAVLGAVVLVLVVVALWFAWRDEKKLEKLHGKR